MDWTKKVGRKQVGRKQVGRKLAHGLVVACDVADHPWTEVESDTIKSVDMISRDGRFPSGAVAPELSGMPVVWMAKVCLEAGILLAYNVISQQLLLHVPVSFLFMHQETALHVLQ